MKIYLMKRRKKKNTLQSEEDFSMIFDKCFTWAFEENALTYRKLLVDKVDLCISTACTR